MLLVLLALLACRPDQGPAESTAGDDTGAGATAQPSLSVAHDPAASCELAPDAIALAPAWVRDDLAISLAAVRSTTCDELAALLVDLDEPWLTDEVAFAVAHTSPEILDLHAFYPVLLVDNARWIYALDEDLAYVDLVDEGEPWVDDDYHTTATYRVQLAEEDGGAVVERTIDPQVYYWYVVHPRMEDEYPYYIDGWASCAGQQCPTSPDEGMFWREFLWQGAQVECPSDRECPVLSEYLTSGVDVLWKNEAYSSDNGAIGAIIQWEQAAITFGAGDERPIQPNRIYAVGCGNCGEWADMATAAARTALIPSRNAGARANDHTWNEFWDEGWNQWEPVNTYVLHYTYYADTNGDYYRTRDLVDNDCDGVTDDGDDTTDSDGDGVSAADGDCDDTDASVHPGAEEVEDNLRDDDCDGIADDGTDSSDADLDGFTVAEGDCDDTDVAVHPEADDPKKSSNVLFCITDSRGDTLVTTEDTAAYGREAYLAVTVRDRDGQPVDGAVVTVYGNWSVYGYPDYPAWAGEEVTDTHGEALVHVGEANPYGISVASEAGYDPEEGYYYGDVVEWAEPGESYEIDLTVNGDVPDGLDVQVIDQDVAAQATLGFQVVLDGGRTRADGAYEGSSTTEASDVWGAWAVVDEANYALFEAGGAFEAIDSGELPGGASWHWTEVSLDRTWYLVLANPEHVATTLIADLEVSLAPLDGDFEPVSLAERAYVGPQDHLAVTVNPGH